MWQKWLNKKPLILETGEQFAHWFFFLRTPTERSNKTKKQLDRNITELKGKLKTKKTNTYLEQHQEFYGDVTWDQEVNGKKCTPAESWSFPP